MPPIRIRLTFIICLFLSPSSILFSEEIEPDYAELLSGFDDSENTTNQESSEDLLGGFLEDSLPQPSEQSATPLNWYLSMTTHLSLSGSYNIQHAPPAANKTDYRGLSRLKAKIQPEWRFRFSNNWDGITSMSVFYDLAYTLNRNRQYTEETLESYESELELWEAYIRGSVSDNFDIKIGRQIVVWGSADSIRVVDILNPLDFREPGMIDIKDIRLPVTMFKANYYFDQWNASVILTPEIRFNKLPTYGSEFYVSDNKLPNEITPDSFNFNTLELAFAVEGVFSGWDISFYVASYFDDQARLIFNENKQPVSQTRSKLQLFGVASNIVFGDWLVKIENAYVAGLRFSTTETNFSRWDILLGLDYSGLSDTTLSVEMANRKIFKYEKSILIYDKKEEYEKELAFRYTRSFMHDKISTTALAAIFGLNINAGGYYRGSIKYEIMDATSVTVGGIIYQSGSNFFMQKIAQNDRVFVNFRYSF